MLLTKGSLNVVLSRIKACACSSCHASLYPSAQSVMSSIDVSILCPSYTTSHLILGFISHIDAKIKNCIPSDTELLLTKNYSEVIIFGKITNLTRNSLKMSLFPGHFESTKSLEIITRNNSQGIIFVIISCQRVMHPER